MDPFCKGQRITLIEVVMDVCDNTYSQGACTASGTPCYNTWAHCQDQCNFSCSLKSYWFSDCIVPVHLAVNYTPNIASISSDPTTLEAGKTFSTRGRITIQFTDDKHNDQGFDPYWPRGAIPICPEDMPGTLFGRWIERTRFFENRKVNVYTGYDNQVLDNFEKRTYFIESVTGPETSGSVRMVLKDPLILADDKTAKCPQDTQRLVATQTVGNEYLRSFTLGTKLDGLNDGKNDALPYALVGTYLSSQNYVAGDPDQDKFFARLRHICVGKEVMEVRAEINPATPSGWNIVLVDRGVCGSEVEEHEAGVQITAAETFRNEHIGDVVTRLLCECAELRDIAISCCMEETEDLLDHDSFEKYRCDAPLNYICETIICKSVGVTTLLKELSEQFLFFLYYDSTVGKIRIRHIAPPDCNTALPTLYECDVEENTFQVKTTDSRYNRIDFLYEMTDCSGSLSKENLSSKAISVTADSLAAVCDRREYKTTKTKTILSRWITECNSFLALAYGERLLKLKRFATKHVSASTTTEVASQFTLGEYAKINHSKLQSVDGTALEAYWLVKAIDPMNGCVKISFERTEFNERSAPYLNCDSDCPTLAVDVDDCDPNSCLELF